MNKKQVEDENMKIVGFYYGSRKGRKDTMTVKIGKKDDEIIGDFIKRGIIVSKSEFYRRAIRNQIIKTLIEEEIMDIYFDEYFYENQEKDVEIEYNGKKVQVVRKA